MVTFDQVLPELLRVCEAAPAFDKVRAAVVVRDLHGRVRLVLDPDLPTSVDITALTASLVHTLGAYFAPPIWSTSARTPDESRLANEVVQRSSPWAPGAYDDIAGRREPRTIWRRMDRRLSKQEWLETGQARPPWPLRPRLPAITTFYSFKGGVGRTTALLSCAWQLARAGHKVAVIDLDLEAPGLGALLGVETRRGVTDYLVDHIATGSGSLEGMASQPPALGDDAGNFYLFPAGNLDLQYIEKLARLDFVTAAAHADSPAELALTALLKQIRAELHPEYIFIDSRAGLHDIAGLSLHRLAHVDVLVARAGEQSYRGLDLALQALCRRKSTSELQCLFVHTMAPGKGLREAIAEEEEFRGRAFTSFARCIYGAEGAQVFAEDASDAPHIPWVLRLDNRLVRFADVSTLAEPLLQNADYRSLLDRVRELCTPSEEPPE